METAIPCIVSVAVRGLRNSLDETQHQFANRLGTSIRTIARWETRYPPRGKALGALLNLAHNQKQFELALVFDRAQSGKLSVGALALEVDMLKDRLSQLEQTVGQLTEKMGENYAKNISRITQSG
jgi:transcriptional regulator with XRE-family HTH domain